MSMCQAPAKGIADELAQNKKHHVLVVDRKMGRLHEEKLLLLQVSSLAPFY